MALFRRLKTPFVEDLPDGEAALPSGPQSAGDLLRQQREALRLGLDDVAAALRIKPDYLAALEAGRPDLLPGPAYAVGFLRTYSDYLSLDGGEILRRFKAESAGLDAKPDLAFPMPLGERSIPGGGTLLVALILVFCGYGTWYYLSTVERSRPQRVAELPSELLPLISGQRTGEPTTPPLAQAAADTQPVAAPGAEFSVPTPTNSGLGSTGEPVSAPPVPPPAQAPASAVSTLPPAPPPILVGLAPAAPGEGTRGNEIVDAPVRIVIRATADSWVRIRDLNGSVLLDHVLKPGESYRVPDRPGVSMHTGNAGGLEISVDGQPAPSIGPNGAVRKHVSLEPQALISGTAVGG